MDQFDALVASLLVPRDAPPRWLVEDPEARLLLGAWRQARRWSADMTAQSWLVALLAELGRRGQVDWFDRVRRGAGDGWLPLWAAGPPVNPSLQHVFATESVVNDIGAGPVEGSVRILAGDVVYVLDVDAGTTTRRELDGETEQLFLRSAGFRRLAGRDVVAAVSDERLWCWDADYGQLLVCTDPDDLPRRAGRFTAAALGPDTGNGTAVMVAGTDSGEALFWRIPDGVLLARHRQAHDGGVGPIAVSADGRRAVTACSDSKQTTLRFWDPTTYQPVGEPRTMDVDGGTTEIGWHPCDPIRVVTVSNGGCIRHWSVDGDLAHSVDTGVDLVHCAAYALFRGRPVALIGGRRVVQVVDLDTGEHLGHYRTGFPYGIGTLATAGVGGPEGSLIAIQDGSSEGRVHVFDLATPAEPGNLDPDRDETRESPYLGIRLAEPITVNGQPRIATLADNHIVGLLDATDGRTVGGPYGVPEVHGATWRIMQTTQVAGRPVAVVLSSESWHGFQLVHLDDGTSRAPVDRQPYPAQPTGLACFHLAGAPMLAFTDRLGNLLLWDLTTMRLTATRKHAHPGGATSVAVAHTDNGLILVTGGVTGGIRRFRIPDLTDLDAPIPAHDGHVTAIEVRTVGGRATIISGGEDARLATWDLTTGRPAGPTMTHPAAINQFLTHPSTTGTIAVTGCLDGTIRGWDLTTATLIAHLTLPAPANPTALLDGDLLAVTHGTLIRLPTWTQTCSFSRGPTTVEPPPRHR